jgi:hypothetical protein
MTTGLMMLMLLRTLKWPDRTGRVCCRHPFIVPDQPALWRWQMLSFDIVFTAAAAQAVENEAY